VAVRRGGANLLSASPGTVPGKGFSAQSFTRLLQLLAHDEAGLRLLSPTGGGHRAEPGFGKTALLEYALESEAGFRIARAGGVESEIDLAFAAVHQLCVPMLA
jgi:hypothetical protein